MLGWKRIEGSARFWTESDGTEVEFVTFEYDVKEFVPN